MSEPHLTLAHPAELLAVGSGRIYGEAKVFLTLRLEDGSFAATNIALSPQQARRLLDDLTEQFVNSKLLEGFSSSDDGGKRIYDQIMADSRTSETLSKRTGDDTELPPEEPK